MALPTYAYGLGPLEGFTRIPAIQFGANPVSLDADTFADQTSVGGVHRRDLIGSRKQWEIPWRTLLESEIAWLIAVHQGQRRGTAPAIYFRDGTYPNLLPPRVSFGVPSGVGPDGISPAWTATGAAVAHTGGIVPVDASESLTVAVSAIRSTGTETVTVALRWVDAAGVQVSESTGTATVGTTWTTVSATGTRPATARGVLARVTATVAVSYSQPRIRFTGTTWFPPGGSARVLLDPPEFTQVSPTETDVKLTLSEVG